MKKSQFSFWVTAVLWITPLFLHAQPFTLPLWEGDPPNYQDSGEKIRYDTSGIVRIRLVQHPDITVFLPAQRNANGDAILICPGGGYSVLAWDWEGIDIARWFSSHGMAAIVLKYRLPVSQSVTVPHETPLMDAQRAMRLVRTHAEEWNIDPARVGIMGFSAGGHLASTLSTHFDAGDAGSDDPVERHSCRPDFSVLMYPVISFTGEFRHSGSRRNLLGEEADPELVKHYSNELQVNENTPPAILIHSGDDKAVPVENSIVYYRALLENGVPAEMHVYPYGGHGFSLAIGQGHLSTWPDRVLEWIRSLE